MITILSKLLVTFAQETSYEMIGQIFLFLLANHSDGAIMSSSTNKQDENSKKPKEQPKTETSLLHKKLSNYQVTDLKGVSYINILLIGEKGAGKSSLLSTFHRSIFNNYTEPPIAQVGTRQTKVLQFLYKLNNCKGIYKKKERLQIEPYWYNCWT